MGERKGVNKYYPPDFDYKKHGSLDRYHNSHPLRERARKLKSEGILIIRFEMPYNIWCNGCNSHIGMGVRYNSEKKKVGNYYSTIIYKFRMKCHLCPQYFEIQTDPANCEYVILSGARRKEERWDAKDNEQIEMTDHAVKKQLITDPMFKLEHVVKDRKKMEVLIPTLSEIQDLQDMKKDDYLLNKALRSKFRTEKKRLEEVAKNDKALLQNSSLDIELLPESETDKKVAELMQYETVKSLDVSHHEARSDIIHQPIIKPTLSSKSEQLLGNFSSNLPKALTPAILAKTTVSNLWDRKNSLNDKKPTSHLKSLGVIVMKRKRSLSETGHEPALITKVSRTKVTNSKSVKTVNSDILTNSTIVEESNQTSSKEENKTELSMLQPNVKTLTEPNKPSCSNVPSSSLVAEYSGSSTDDDS